jgi:hypothetical protein
MLEPRDLACRIEFANGYPMSDDVSLTLVHGEADELAGHE